MFTRVWPGKPYPLGATWDGCGVNFASYSGSATKAELCKAARSRCYVSSFLQVHK
jgi:pullulanase/glycogen debranching enzyme